MSPRLELRSMSGVRPFLAFGLISVALGLVVVQLVLLASHEVPRANAIGLEDKDFREPTRLVLEDREGQVLARSQRGYMLEASPFNLWMRHTPERIVLGLAPLLGLEPAKLWTELCPAAEDGRVHLARWPLTHSEALVLADWIESGGPKVKQSELVGPLPGLIIERATPTPELLAGPLNGLSGPYFQLAADLDLLLSEATRSAVWPALAERRGAAQAWVTRLTTALFERLSGPFERERQWVLAESLAQPGGLAAGLRLPPGVTPCWRIESGGSQGLHGLEGEIAAWLEGQPEDRGPRLELKGTRVEWVFEGLCPARYCVLSKFIDSEVVEPLRALLTGEQLSSYELWLVNTAQRRYPAPLDPLAEAPADRERRPGPIGRYGWYQGQDELGHECPQFGPQEGLEALCEGLIAQLEAEVGTREQGTLAGIGHPEALELTVRHPRAGWQRTVLESAQPARAPAEVKTTIDLALSRRVYAALERLVADQDAGLAMAVAIELSSRDILALEWVDPYGFPSFAPLVHQFTPGSTFKLVTMGAALDGGYVAPQTEFEVGSGGAWPLHAHPDGTGRVRVIHEADGYAEGRQSAAMCLARSSNAGMVQIGLSVPVERWKSFTRQLGYGTPALPGLLAEWMANPRGQVGEARSDGREWSRLRSHASVSFGDSISTNLLQHAQALASLLGSGEFRPLNLVREIDIDGHRYAPKPPQPVPVIAKRTSQQLREMMRIGALEGTGKELLRPRGLELMTKTGTTEKLRNDVCWHAFGERYAASVERHEDFDQARVHKQLAGKFRGAKPCYVSSIAVLGRAPDSDREVLVLVVVDDPHRKERFGSKVAGPTAVEILCMALGWELPDQLGVSRDLDGLVQSHSQVVSYDREPWAATPEDALAPWWQTEAAR